MKKIIIYCLLLLALPTSLLAQVTIVTVGTSGNEALTLKEAFDAINNGDIQGEIILQIIDNTSESATAVLYESGHGSSSYSSVTIYPTDPGYVISGSSIDDPLIELNGATNVTFDGRVNQTGSANLIITNTNTGSFASTFRFIQSASNNTLQYCIIKGAETSPSSGVLFFSTASVGSGNNGNKIDHNNITGNSAGRSVNAIFSSGTSGNENRGNIISNNNIFDFLNQGVASNGIYLYNNTTTWTISGNSFYETASFTPTSSAIYNCINIDNTSATGFTISGNFIGGQDALCGSSAWNKTNAFDNIFYAIYLNIGTTIASNVQNNTIQNIAWRNYSSADWTGIHIASGTVNIGTGTGNTIGATTGTGSIIVTDGGTGGNVYGINIASLGTVDCQNNNIGSITAANSNANNATNLYGINKTSTSGTTTISNNSIGSATYANSVNANSACITGAQSLYGISNSGTGNITISNNTIANLTNGTTNSGAGTAGLINGIRSTSGTNTISDNTISDLTIANANTSTDNMASVCGIALTGTTLKTVHANTIYNLRNTFSSFAGNVTGVYFMGNTGANVVEENFIHSLSVTGASSTSASIYGIQTGAGATTCSNNIISLGGASQTTIYGIYETGAAGNDNNLYFNTVYIGGSPSSGSNKSYALYSAVNTNTRNFRNNIFFNARSTTAGSNLHYAAYIVSTGGITIDYNDYFTSGTGGIFGYFAADIASLPAWKTATGQDAASVSIDPLFSSPGGTIAANYQPSAGTLTAVAGTGISTDYDGSPRSIPTMGAFEIGCTNPSSGGTISADQSGCTPFDPAAFTSTILPSGHTGTLDYKWQQSNTSAVAGFADIPTSNSSTYIPGSITQDTWYKRVARVLCKVDFTGAAESNVVKASVNPLPTANPITGGAETCIVGSISLTSNASGTPALSYTWASSNNGTATVNNSGVVTPIAAGSTDITYTVTDGNTCKATAPLHTVTVDPFPATGLTVGGNGLICSGSATNISVALSVSGINYQLRNDNANELVGTAVAGNGGTILLSTLNLTTNTIFNVLATNTTTTCSAQLTQTALVSIDPPSAGGSISGTSSITYGSSTGTMTLASYTGIVQRWEKRFNSGSWTTISNTTATYSETPSSAGTWDYRAFVKNGTCVETSSSVFSITVNKASLTITAGNKNKNYGASLPILTVSYSGFVNGDVAPATLPTISTTATAASPVGIYPITASGAADPNYNISYVAGSLTIDKVALIITADNKNKNYGASLPVLTVSYSGLVNGDFAPVTPPSLSTTATAASPVGTYPITASGAADSNYNISYVAGTLTVDKVTLTITAVDKNKNYGTSLPVFTVTYSGFVNGDVAPATLPTMSTTATTSSPVGTYPITASGAADPNYNISYVAGTLTVDKVALTITAVNKNKNYGASLPIFTVTYSGFVNGDVSPTTLPTISTTATAASPVGTYPITAAGAADPNYTINYVAGTLTVDKVALTITAVDKNKNYGTSLPVFTVTYSGFVNGDVAPLTLSTISTTATVSSPVGTYPITVTAAADPNYNISYVAGTLTVDKVALTITADNKTKLYLAQNPVLTYSFSGFVNGETQSVLDVLPTIQTTALQNSPLGNYPITITVGSDNNYNYIYVSGTLSITKIAQTITFTGFPEKLLVKDSYTLTATSTSGLTVLFESLNTELATISGNTLTGVAKGNVSIRAYNTGDQNYSVGEAIVTVEIYSTHRDIMHLFTPNNDGINDQWELPELAAWGKCDVRVFNRWGKLVFADANYNNLWDGTSNGSPLPEGPYYFIIKTQNAGMVKGTVNIVR